MRHRNTPTTGTTSGNERSILRSIMTAVGSLSHCRIFRNNVGQAYQGRAIGNHNQVLIECPRTVKYGLYPGSSDLIGWTTVVITPDMVGRKVAVFTSIEVKAARGGVSPKQGNWLDRVREAGGIAAAVRSVGEAVRAVSASNAPERGTNGRTNGGGTPRQP